MKRNVLSIILAVILVLSLLPAAALAADPEGTIIVTNNVAGDSSEARFVASKTIEATYSTNGNLVQSGLSGYGEKKAVAVYYPGTYVRWYLAKGATAPAGTYDIYIYNVVNNGTDKFRDGTIAALPGYHARYSVHTRQKSNNTLNSTNDNESVYYINQATVSGSTNGWVKLGTHYFSGADGVEYVELRNDLWNSYAYASAVKFVPVNRPSSAKLTHVYTKTNKESAASVNDTNLTSLAVEENTVTSNNIVIRIPKEYGAETTVSGGNRRKLHYMLETEDPDAKIFNENMVQINAADKPSYQGQAYIEYGGEVSRTIYVKSEDETKTERYDISFIVEKKDGNISLPVPTSVTNGKNGNFWMRSAGTVVNNVGSFDATNSNLTSGWGSLDESYTGNAKLGTLGNFVHWSLTKEDTSIKQGYYNVYLHPTFHSNLMGEYADIIIDHAGIKEHKLVKPGKYHKATMQKVLVGTYYFDGSGNESVAVMNPSECLEGKQLCVSGMELVPTSASASLSDFDGVVIETASGDNRKSFGVTRDMIEDGNYIQPISGSEPTLKVIGSNSKVEYVKVNGDAFTLNTAKAITLAAGENEIEIAVKLQNTTENIYKFNVFQESGLNCVTRTTTEGENNGYTYFIAPISCDPWNTGAKTAYISDETTASNKNYFKFSDEASAGYYKVLAYKPGFNHSVNSGVTNSTEYNKQLTYTVKTKGGNFTNTVDWSGNDSRWVDLGDYYFTNSSTDNNVTFKQSTERNLLDTVKYIKLSDGISIDGEFAELENISDSIFYTEASSVKIKHAVDGEESVLVNETKLSAETETEISLKDGINHMKLTVGEDTYNFAVVKTATTLLWDEIGGDLESVENVNGYKGNGAAIVIETEAVFNAPDTLDGEYDAYVYFVPVTEDYLDGLSSTVSVSVNDSAGTVMSTDVTPTNEGWMKIGDTFNISSVASNEGVTIKADDSSIAFVSAVKFVKKVDDAQTIQPVIIEKSGSVSAMTYVYSQEAKNVRLILASFDKETGKLNSAKLIDATISGGAQRIETPSLSIADRQNTSIKAFIWSKGTLKPLSVPFEEK